MLDLTASIESWLNDDKQVALATVVHVWGSAPRPLGSKMAISSAGDVTGSVSGGCVEGAVVDAARSVMETGQAALVRFDVTNDEAWAVGLTCGGVLEVFIEAMEIGSAVQRTLAEEVAAERSSTLATVVDGPGTGSQLLILGDGRLVGGLGSTDLNEWARRVVVDDLQGVSAMRRKVEARDGEIVPSGDSQDLIDVFFETCGPPPKLVIVGAVHVAIPLVSLARTMGYRTLVVDPRSRFATEERFPHADELFVKWPEEAIAEIGINETTSVAVLSHDLKIDVPALRAALASPARYIGALGSKKTHAKRIAALAEAGLSEEQIARVHSPIGLDIGGRKAEEIALSVIAEVVAASHGRA